MKDGKVRRSIIVSNDGPESLDSKIVKQQVKVIEKVGKSVSYSSIVIHLMEIALRSNTITDELYNIYKDEQKQENGS